MDGHHVRPPASDLLTGGLAIAVGLGVIWYAAGMPEIRPGIPGPGLFPTMIGGFLVLFGAALLFTSWRAARRGRPALVDEEPEVVAGETETAETVGVTGAALATSQRSAIINAVAFIAAIAFYIVAAEFLGFMLTMGIITIGLMLLLRVTPWKAIVIGLATTIGLWALFEKLLLVQLPDGLLGF